MNPFSNNGSSSSSEGSFKSSLVNDSTQDENGIWGVPRGKNSAFASTDTSFFSTSLPVLQRDKWNFRDLHHSHKSLEDGLHISSNFLQEVKDPLEDNDPHTLRTLLPDDEHKLLTDIMDDFDLSRLPNKIEDLEDDFFSSGGGMELDDTLNIGTSSRVSVSSGFGVNGIVNQFVPNSVGTVVGEHPHGEHPSRTLFVRNINSTVEDNELKNLFKEYGDIRNLHTTSKHRGFVMISYYDIRAALTAMRALQHKSIRNRKLDIHFSIPKDNPSEKDLNQGTLVVFNLDESVSNDDLLKIFGVHGEVKEIRETPNKRHHKFIEFYDVRAADAALKALNRCKIAGKQIKLEPSRPGGARRNLMQQLSQELEQEDARSFQQQIGSPVTSSPPGNWGSPLEHNPLRSLSRPKGIGTFFPINNNHLTGLASILPTHHVSHSPKKIAPIGINQLRNKDKAVLPNPQSLPDHNIEASSGTASSFDDLNSNSPGIETLSGPEFLWGSPTTPQFEITNISNGQKQSLPYSGRTGFLHGSNHHVGSAPSGHIGSPVSSFRGPTLFNGVGVNHNGGSYMMNMGSPHGPMMRGPIFFGNGSFSGLMASNNEGSAEHIRRRVENNEIQMENKKLYQLDLNKIVNGEDTRTTLMIKNIPNKYTSKMLLASIDENHRGTYDFLYLPIDFKNKCNVGYAFINMVSSSHIVPFYKEFNGKKWEKFNSGKVASLAFGRIQGKAALVTHFKNSSLMNEDRWCRPILFHSERPETSDREMFQSSNLNIYIRQPDGSYSGDSLDDPPASDF